MAVSQWPEATQYPYGSSGIDACHCEERSEEAISYFTTLKKRVCFVTAFIPKQSVGFLAMTGWEN